MDEEKYIRTENIGARCFKGNQNTFMNFDYVLKTKKYIFFLNGTPYTYIIKYLKILFF